MRRDRPSSRKCTAALVRKSAATVAMMLQTRLAAEGISARTTHRDIGQDVVQR
jgi:hypothetical protein